MGAQMADGSYRHLIMKSATWADTVIDTRRTLLQGQRARLTILRNAAAIVSGAEHSKGPQHRWEP